MGGGRRRKNARRERPRPTKIDAVPDEILELVFLRLSSPAHLVRAACTCRRWRRVIAGDGGRFLRSLHGASPAHVVGHYRVDKRDDHPSPPGANPVFVTSSSASSPCADTVAARNLALDFLPQLQYGDGHWELADIRGPLLLLVHFNSHMHWPPTALAVCDHLTWRYRMIPHSAWFRDFFFLGAFLLDGDGEDDDEDAGSRISLSNFSVTCAIYRCKYGIVKACAFSSAGRGRWNSSGSAAVDRARRHHFTYPIQFAGSTDRSAYWTIGGNIVICLDKDAAELSASVLPDNEEYAALRDKRHALEYAYQLPWPRYGTIEACLS